MSGEASKLSSLMGFHFVFGKLMAFAPVINSGGDVWLRKEQE